MIEQKGLPGFISFVKELADIAAGFAKKLFVHLVFSNISADIVVASENAAQTALNYGYVCAAVTPAMSALIGNCKCKKYHISLVPDFDEKECRIAFFAKARIKLLFLVSFGLSALIQVLKVMKSEKTAEEN